MSGFRLRDRFAMTAALVTHPGGTKNSRDIHPWKLFLPHFRAKKEWRTGLVRVVVELYPKTWRALPRFVCDQIRRRTQAVPKAHDLPTKVLDDQNLSERMRTGSEWRAHEVGNLDKLIIRKI